MKYLKLIDAQSDIKYLTNKQNVIYKCGDELTFVPHYNMIDLDLPSGTLWADRNIGALTETDGGTFFQWGDTQEYTVDQISTEETTVDDTTKKYFDYTDYKWCDGTETSFTKYCYDSSYGTVDNKTELDLSDDAAYVNTGHKMPSPRHFSELIANTNQEYIENYNDSGINGWKFISKTNEDKYIFIPSGIGYVVSGGKVTNEDEDLNTWYLSSELNIKVTHSRCFIVNSSHIANLGGLGRRAGSIIRCIEEGHNKYTYKTVDLGLPSGNLWCDRNVCALNETDYGLFFQWGSTVGCGYNTYDAFNSYYSVSPTNGRNSSLNLDSFTDWVNKNCTNGVLNLDVDAAYVNMGKEWKMPTAEDMQEVIDNTTKSYVTINGVYCLKYANKNDETKYIVIPMSGGYAGNGLQSPNNNKDGWSYGHIWTSTVYRNSETNELDGTAQQLSWPHGYVNNYPLYMSFNIRAIKRNN